MRLTLFAILFALLAIAQENVTPEQSLRRALRQSQAFTETEKKALAVNVRAFHDECALTAALFSRQDQSRQLIAVAISLNPQDRNASDLSRNLLEQLIATKINTLLCDTVLDQLGLYSTRRPRYDRVMGIMLAYSMPKEFIDNSIETLTSGEFHILVARLNDRDILSQFHNQGPSADPTAIATNRNRLRNAINKQIARETLGFLQQARQNPERLQDARRCLDELNKIEKTQKERFPNDVQGKNSAWNAAPAKDAATYCLLLADSSNDSNQERINEAFFAMTDSISELPQAWFDTVKEYAVKYHRKQDYDYLMSSVN